MDLNKTGLEQLPHKGLGTIQPLKYTTGLCHSSAAIIFILK